MELQREPRKKTTITRRHVPSQPSKTIEAIHSPESISVKRPLGARDLCITMGLLLITLSMVGFVTGSLFGAHLTYTANVIHIFTGVLSLGIGLFLSQATVVWAWTMMIFYGLWGALGFVFGNSAESYLWEIVPEKLIVSTPDHSLHLLLAAGFLIGAALSKRNVARSISSV